MNRSADIFIAGLAPIDAFHDNAVLASVGFVGKAWNAPRSNPEWFFLLCSIWIASTARAVQWLCPCTLAVFAMTGGGASFHNEPSLCAQFIIQATIPLAIIKVMH